MSWPQKLLFVFVIFFSLWLRFYHYTYFPQRGATSDEYTYSFLGTSLLSRGVPISWSNFPEYKKWDYQKIDGILFPLVQPYFDHPPGYALTLGTFLLAFGQVDFTSQQLGTIRLMPIILSTLTGVLLFFLTKKLFGFTSAIFSFLLYSSVTIFVMNQRVSVSENQLALLFIFAVYLFSVWQKKFSNKHLLVLGLLAGLALLTKIMGIALFVSLLFLLIYQNVSLKKIFLFALPFVFCFFLLMLYAHYYNWELFWQIQAAQSGRNIGPQSLWMLFLQSVIVNKVYYDGWYFLGLLALSFLALDFKKNALLLVPSLTYFLFLVFSLSKEGQSGWYMIPLFPFMSIAIALFVQDCLRKKSLLFLLVPLLIGFSQIQYFFEPYFGMSSIVYRMLVALLFAPLLLLFLFKKETWYTRFGYLSFVGFIIVSMITTYRYMHPS